MPEEQQQQQQEQTTAVKMPQVNPNLLAGDDYVYEPKPLPKKPFGDQGQDTQAGGMAGQFDMVTSALNKNV